MGTPEQAALMIAIAACRPRRCCGTPPSFGGTPRSTRSLAQYGASAGRACDPADTTLPALEADRARDGERQDGNHPNDQTLTRRRPACGAARAANAVGA